MPKRSPFATLTNTTLTFNVPASVGVLNAAGNLTVTTTPVIVTAYLAIQPRRAKNSRPKGVPVIADAFDGYVVEVLEPAPALGDIPFVLPDNVQPLMTAIAVVGGETGTFTLDATMINPPYGRSGLGLRLERVTGTKFSGWFVKQ